MADSSINSIDDLKPDPRNANKGTERGDGMLEESLRRHGAGRSALADRRGVLIAGNKTVQKAAELGLPIRPIHTDGNELVVVVRDDLDLEEDDENYTARSLAYMDNRVGEANLAWAYDVIAEDRERGVPVDLGWTQAELAEAVRKYQKSNGQEEESSPGERLLANLELYGTAARHEVKNGEVYSLGHHYLCVVPVFTGWPIWAPLLEDERIFAPFPGPFVALTKRAEETPVVMVQPETYVAARILDAYEDVYGDKEIHRLQV